MTGDPCTVAFIADLTKGDSETFPLDPTKHYQTAKVSRRAGTEGVFDVELSDPCTIAAAQQWGSSTSEKGTKAESGPCSTYTATVAPCTLALTHGPGARRLTVQAGSKSDELQLQFADDASSQTS